MNHKEVGSVDSGSVLHDQHGWGSLAVSGNGSSCLLRFLGIFFLRIVVGGQFGNFRLLQQPCLCSGGKIECENDQKNIFCGSERARKVLGDMTPDSWNNGDS